MKIKRQMHLQCMAVARRDSSERRASNFMKVEIEIHSVKDRLPEKYQMTAFYVSTALTDDKWCLGFIDPELGNRWWSVGRASYSQNAVTYWCELPRIEEMKDGE